MSRRREVFLKLRMLPRLAASHRDGGAYLGAVSRVLILGSSEYLYLCKELVVSTCTVGRFEETPLLFILRTCSTNMYPRLPQSHFPSISGCSPPPSCHSKHLQCRFYMLLQATLSSHAVSNMLQHQLEWLQSG